MMPAKINRSRKNEPFNCHIYLKVRIETWLHQNRTCWNNHFRPEKFPNTNIAVAFPVIVGSLVI